MPQSRYHRQTLLENIDQTKITHAKTLVIGAGGLGCPALQYLAAAGVGHIGIVDHDTVDKTNLHRQILFTENDIGQNKAIIAKKRLETLNSDITITAHDEKFTAENAETLVQNYDIIIDGTDNFKSKYLINDACVKYEKPLIAASVLRFEGQVMLFQNNAESACYRCLYPDIVNPPLNCNQAGVLGSVAGTVGTMQATIAISYICDAKKWANTLWTFDATNGRTTTLTIPKKSGCMCGLDKKNIILKKIESQEEISVSDARMLENVLFIDVREQDEWDAGYIPDAVFHSLSRIQTGEMPDIPSDKHVVIYCRSGARSLYVTQILRDQGHTHVQNMTGGILAWDAA